MKIVPEFCFVFLTENQAIHCRAGTYSRRSPKYAYIEKVPFLCYIQFVKLEFGGEV